MQSAFIEMAAKSASRLRVFLPHAQILLIMSVLPGSLPNCGPDTQAWLDVFSRVLLVPDSPYNRQVHQNECWLEKPGLLRLSPFDVTVYLDADTRIFSSGFASVLATLVRKEKDFAAVTEIATSRSQKLIGREIFNCGFFAFRQSAPRVIELMARYRALCWRNRERLAAGDCISPYRCCSHRPLNGRGAVGSSHMSVGSSGAAAAITCHWMAVCSNINHMSPRGSGAIGLVTCHWAVAVQ